jgi:hypothetical protein
VTVELDIPTITDSTRRCAHCGEPLFSTQPYHRFCSNRCKCRARRRRERGLPEHAYPDGGNRSRLRMGQPTKAERGISSYSRG